LAQVLRRRPSLRILKRILELRSKKSTGDQELQLALVTLEKFLADKPVFHCENCGFSSRSMHWQCPGCKQWDRVKPIHGIEGD
jgi:lipopolysaccharide biosynthesis regulator YciM